MGAFSSDIVPIPKVTEIGETEHGFYAISERVRGKHLDELSGPEIEHVLPQLIDALYEFQKLDLSDTQVVGIWHPEGAGLTWGDKLLSVAEPRDRQPGWREQLNASPQEAKIFDDGVARLRQLVTKLPEHRGIIHSDLLNRNVLVHQGKLTGIIDWGNAFYGDPLYDIAWLIYWWSWYPDWQKVDLQVILDRHWDKHGGQPPQLEERLRCCLIHIGLDHIAYCAFRQRPADMRRNAKQLLSYI
nr:aminoglycoside phosphotransferase family protein [Paenibacillus sp. Marseille-Q4541]